jgi:hypothetical protein
MMRHGAHVLVQTASVDLWFCSFCKDPDSAQGVDYKKGIFRMAANSRARCNDDIDGLIKVLGDKKTDRVLGIHMITPVCCLSRGAFQEERYTVIDGPTHLVQAAFF